ncbi:MAG: T9SS-dependent M36 family metallopeptidase [Bacteroidota bacterium]
MIIKLRNIVLLSLFLILPTILPSQTKLSDSPNGRIVEEYLMNQKARYGFDDKDIEDFLVTSEVYSKNSGVNYMYINQLYNNIKIYNAITTVAIKEDEVFSFNHRIQFNVKDKIEVTTPTVDVMSAINKLNNELNLGASSFTVSQIGQRRFEITSDEIVEIPIEAELVYVPMEEKLLLAWDMTIYLKDGSHWWSVRVDAINNNIIDQYDMILTCQFDHPRGSKSHINGHQDVMSKSLVSPLFSAQGSYNVYAYPVESPIHGNRSIATNSNSIEASPFGWHDTNGNEGSEYTITRGNNVFAREDRDANNFGGYSPDGGSSLNFDYSLDLTDSPESYQDAAIANLFYWNNVMHDVWFEHGFDEASGNFQEFNYTAQGLGLDSVNADAQDGSGFNNANFGTPPEGANPRMQMFLWQVAGPLDINNGSLAGSYNAVAAGFGESLTTPLTGDLALTLDGGSDPNDACQSITNGSDINGKIAVIRRGSCEFGLKVLEAEDQGAIAVIMVNNVSTAPISMAPGAVGNQVTIPSVMISQSDGEALISELESNESISATLNREELVDGDFDNGIIAHEYGHGISNRLVGGAFNVGCLRNDIHLEQMGEGWSDWFGLMVTMTSEDTPEQRRGIGTFPLGEPTNGNGIRPAPYSTDFAQNDFTYANSNFGVSQPHGVGFVYATALWDLTWAYIDKYGFDPDLYNGDGGNNKVMTLVIESLKLIPCAPGFIDGRDSLLAADQAITGGADACMIWEVFANRGMGFAADQGSSLSRSDQTEDFTLPPANDPSIANCSSLSTESFNISELKIYPNPTNSGIFIETKNGLGSVSLSVVDLNGRIVIKEQVVIFDTFQLNIANLESGIYLLKLQGESIDFNHKIIKN